MSIYLGRFHRYPRPVTQEDAREGRMHQLGHLGQPPTTRDVINSYPMPIEPGEQFTDMFHPANGHGHGTRPGGGYFMPELENQLPGPFLGRDLPPHLYPPRNWENIDQLSYAPIPAVGATTTILTYIVPIGRNGVINKVANNFVGGNWVAGSGDLVWRILIDNAPPPGATSYNNIIDSLGSPAQPVGIAGFRIFENQTINVTLFNNPAGLNGGVIVAGQLSGARLLGHLYPRDMEYHDLWV